MKKPTETATTITTHHNWFGYGMAALIFATAFANMFLGGRIKNVMKVEMPKANWKQAGQGFKEEFTNSSSSHQKYRGYTKGQTKGNHTEKEHDSYASLLTDLGALQSSHLRTLGLSPQEYNEKAVKKAFRQLVLIYHPDRVPANDPNRDECLKKFQAISHSYQVLIDSLQKLNSK